MRFIITRFRTITNHIKWMWGYHRYILENKGDYDWDNGYLQTLMKWKLERMADYHDNHGVTEAAHRVSRQMRYAAYLIDLLEGRQIHDEETAKFEARWGEISFVRKVESPYPKYGKGWKYAIMFAKATTPEEHEEANKEYKKSYDVIDQRQEDAHRRLWNHLSKYSRGWWD